MLGSWYQRIAVIIIHYIMLDLLPVCAGDCMIVEEEVELAKLLGRQGSKLFEPSVTHSA